MNPRLKDAKVRLWRFFVLPFVNFSFVRRPALFASFTSTDPKKLFVITCSFNDVDLIKLQDASLKKFLRDPYEYFVVDNSTKEEGAAAIKEYCLKNGINYARLGENPGNKKRHAGTAHGLGLNWAYRNIVMRYRPVAFGFWDGDLFPTKPVKVSDHLAVSEGWGICIKRRPKLTPWHYPVYLWVGLLFFRTERFGNRMQNFLPTFGVDTGGRVPLDEKIMKAAPDMVEFYTSPLIEIVSHATVRKCGDFIHFEGSTWVGTSVNELDLKKQWMEKLLQEA